MRSFTKITATFLALVMFLTMLPVSPHAAVTSEQKAYSSRDLLQFSRKLTKIADASIRKYRLHPCAGDAYSTARLVVDAGNSDFDFTKFDAVDILQDPNGVYIVQFASPSDARQCAEQIENDPRVRYVHPDSVMKICADEQTMAKAGSSSGLSWGVSHIGADVFAQYLVDKGTTDELIVAVVDTGVAVHPFLEGRRLDNGYDFVDDDADPTDENYHGTHVAGTIVDCTPGLNVKILPVRILDAEGSGYTTMIANGIRYAADNGAKVINMSLGGGHVGNYMEQAVAYANDKGVSVVVAAGNEESDTARCCPAHIFTAITVAAISSDDSRAYFSNYGAAVDVAAPGVDVLSCVPGGYNTLSGTSMATPHVSAAVAMLRLDNPSATPAQAETLVTRYTRDVDMPGKDYYYGYGILDLRKALTEMTVLTDISVTNLPNKTTYYTGDFFNPAGMTVTARYSDGTVKTINRYSFSPTHITATDDQIITVSYTEDGVTKTAPLTVRVKTPKIRVYPTTRFVQANTYTAIAIETEPAGQPVKVRAVNNSCTSFTREKNRLLVTGERVGTDLFELSMDYGELTYTTDLTVHVSEDDVRLTSLALASPPDKTVYYLGDTMDLTGIRLLATYSDGTVVTVDENDLDCDRTFTEAGEETIRLTYSDGVSDAQTVDVPITVNVPDVRFDPSELNLAIDEEKEVTLFCEPEMDLEITEDVSGCVYWSESSDRHLTVVGSKAGTVTLTAKGVYRQKPYTASLTVRVIDEIDGFSYHVIRSGSQAEITGYSGSDEHISIPSAIGGLPVTSIGHSAFYQYPAIRSVTVPDGVDTIGFAAFCANENLESVTIPDTVTTIDDHAFQKCPKLTGIELPAGLSALSRSVFEDCTSLTNITIPFGVRRIGEYAFAGCTALQNVTVPETVEALDDYAFYGCTALMSLTLPRRIDTVGAYAFGWMPDTEDAPERLPGFVVRCYADSAVCSYAIENAIAYELLERIAGDADHNGVVDLIDVAVMRRYLAGWSSVIGMIDLAAADVDGSGSVELVDCILVCRYLAGWNVELI